ncbi:hypothetical protein A3F06_03580 [candidate division TM6 bacterium RIFCSPHIGHO2_12_FULL_36_22]|nr:MAG: hypothetical protein A3F06_03580 [candidate division TM6 bacterium RIFCSPHIGHO2_12_FULL_36_22]
MPRKKTIVHIITSLKVGGAEALLVELVQALRAKNYHNEIIYFHDGPNRQCLEQLGFKTTQISGVIKLYDPIFFVRLIRIVKKLRPHVIHSSLWSANVCARLVGKLLRIPVLCAIHSQTNLATIGTKNSRFRSIIDKLLAHWAQCYVLVSSQMNGFGLPHEKVITIQNGVQLNKSTKNETLTKQFNTNNCFVVGSVGRFSLVKNYSLLLESFAVFLESYTNSVLLLVGQGELEQQLRKQAIQLGIATKVHFIKANKATEYYPLFHCFVMTSWQEGLSIALLEAMSAGVPPIIIKPDGKHEVVQSNNNGILVNVYESKSLAKSLLKLAQNPILQEKLGRAAALTIESEFSFSKMVEQYQREYDKLLGQ